ncbi:lipid-A-disaccharide synthase, partial [Nonlabens mediterrranea]|nr:lipid-A-disaccharide synthase [Nonlabens mediterrranea]
MKYYIIVGEASGDLHGSNLMKSLLKQDPEAQFRFWGGDLMEAVGGEQVMHYKERAIMGFTEVIRKLGAALKNIKYCKEDIARYQPDALIFMDYSGFNLRIAKWAKPKGFNTHYYISPQVWASRESRVKTIKANINHMYVILPFVKDFYEQKHNYPVDFVGHPIIDAINLHQQVNHVEFLNKYQLDERPLIALLPGSRKQEISKMLGVMLQMVDQYPDYQFLIAGSPGQEASFYKPFLKKNVTLVMNRTYDILS